MLALLLLSVIGYTLSTSVADARSAFDFVNLTPADGATISYQDWYAAGSYIRFAIKPDSSYPCASEYYFLEVNGRRVGRFSDSCATSIYVPSPGRYSWRVVLYIFQNAETVTGSVSTFTIAAPAPPTPPAAPVAAHDSNPPRVAAISIDAVVHKRTRLLFSVGDDSGRASALLTLRFGGVLVFRHSFPSRKLSPSGEVSTVWVPKKVGRYRECVTARDPAGNRAGPSCATVRVFAS